MQFRSAELRLLLFLTFGIRRGLLRTRATLFPRTEPMSSAVQKLGETHSLYEYRGEEKNPFPLWIEPLYPATHPVALSLYR
jgi:hypothetical protein